jgi:hypothetical protein
MHPLYFFCRASIGDGGMDLTGSYKKRQLVIQCKNYSSSVGLHEIYVFEGVLSRYTKETTFGVFVVSKKMDTLKMQWKGRNHPNLKYY